MENSNSVNVCQICFSIFVHRHVLLRHQRTVHATSKEFTCHDCSYVSTRKENFNRHQSRKHPKSIKCSECTFMTVKISRMWLHKKKEHRKNQKGDGKD